MKLFALSFLWACSGSEPTEPSLPDPTEDPDRQACAPSLTLQPLETDLGPLSVVQLTATGGTGTYRYSLEEPAYGSVSELTGTYLAPDELGVIDTVVVRDLGCAGEATATMRVGDPFEVLPEAATVLPRTGFTFEISGGSGSFECEAASLTSGGSVSGDCAYEAGPNQGLDRVEVVDVLTGQTVGVTISVDLDASMQVWGTQRWAVPLGSTFVPRVAGGSEVFDLDVLSGPAVSTGAGLRADAVGVGRVEVLDRFAGFRRVVSYEVIAPYVPPSTWFGQASLQGRLLAPGDLDGDGHVDVVMGNIETNGTTFYSGSVAVFAGRAGGFEPDPVWVASGNSTFDLLGRDIDVVDVTGDGQLDLIAGSDGGDLSSGGIGLVRIWRGVSGGFFEDEPYITLRGVYGGDAAGSSVAACDFDGDGFVDVAVGAYGHEDRSEDVYPTNTGAVMVFRGGADGALASEPSVIRYGLRLDPIAGEWTSVTNSRVGLLGMAAGDTDADGRCDLAVSSVDEGIFGSGSSYGWVALYRGAADGLLSEEPVRIFANTLDTNGSLGRMVDLGDVDGDGRDDVVTGAYGYDHEGVTGAGGAFVFLSGNDDGRPATEPVLVEEADWAVYGDGFNNYLGLWVLVADADGDGRSDVLVGEPRGQRPGGTARAGRVRVWSGQTVANSSGDPDADPTLVNVGGPEAESYFGQAAAPVGDVDGDGSVDLVAWAGRSHGPGAFVGRVVFAPAEGAFAELNAPGQAAGNDHGRSMTVMDVDGDGREDLLVGSASDVDLERKRLYAGQVYRFDGQGEGVFSQVGAPHGLAHAGHDSYDRRGQGLASSGDFDGDGTEDLVVLMRSDERPNAFDGSYANPSDCPGSLSNAGSVAIHLGSAAGVSETPAFVAYGIEAGANSFGVASGFDHDGDGFDDVLFSGRSWGANGGVALVRGRRPNDAGITVICDPDVYEGPGATNTRFGESVAAIGDVDGDGCDEFAVGASIDDAGVNNQGIVRVFWGHGATCDATRPRITAVGPGIANYFAGESVAGGGDFDGDGVPDLAVGGTEVRVASDELGGAWIVPGSYLAGLPKANVAPGLLPETEVHPMGPGLGRWGVVGPTPSALFGRSVALVADPQREGQVALAVGAPNGSEGSVTFAGGVHVYRFDASVPGIEEVPFAVVGGEGHIPGGGLGQGVWADTVDGVPVLLVGAPLSSQQGLNLGGAYVVGLR
ncbi:MAG: VCBS repeat-containing protein [Myxococcales bacterium]|nr:VCBS repeat-containing protein [Myxococcales bacterium]